MADDFDAFRKLKQQGEGAVACARAAESAGLSFSTRIRMLREVFDFSLVQAKEAIIVAEGRYSSLDEYQEQLIPVLEAALKALDSD